MRTKTFILFFVLILFQLFGYGQSEGMVRLKGARYVPLYGRDSTVVEVKDFDLDVYPVTNADYVKFVKTYPQWQKSKVKKLFADGTYLRNWKNDGVNSLQAIESRQMEREEAKRKKPQEDFYIPLDGPWNS